MTHLSTIAVGFPTCIDRFFIFYGIKFDTDIFMNAHDNDYVVNITNGSIVLLWFAL